MFHLNDNGLNNGLLARTKISQVPNLSLSDCFRNEGNSFVSVYLGPPIWRDRALSRKVDECVPQTQHGNLGIVGERERGSARTLTFSGYNPV